MWVPRLDRASTVPLSRQLATALRQALAGGSFGPGARLPSTRSLAAELGSQHGCGRFRATRGRRLYRAPTRLRLFCRDPAHGACRFNVGHRRRSGGARHLAPCEITPFGYARLAQVAASLRDGLCRGRRSPDRKLETARIARPSARTRLNWDYGTRRANRLCGGRLPNISRRRAASAAGKNRSS